jgi:hypothetical protein
MFFWMVFSFLQALFSKELRPQSFITVLPGLCFFITHFLLLIRRKKLAEMNIWLLLLGIVSVSYLARYNKIKGIEYEKLFISKEKNVSSIVDKRVLVLGDDFKIYQNNVLATPFLNWNLSKEIFEQPDYYENVIEDYEAFKGDMPDVIIDKSNLMNKFFERIPELKKKYKRSQPEMYKRID